MKKHLLFSIFIFSIIFSSCDLSVGLGDAPDLEAPTLSITSPATLSNTSATPTISGVCSDNKAVSKITVYNTTSASYLENATISYGSWNWTGTLTEGYQTLRFTAYDANSNSSTDSVAQITIIVDVTSPESQNWYIERAAGITTLFTTKTALEAIDTDDSSNKDMAQNVSFIVHGKISDNMSLASVALNVYEGETKLLSLSPDKGSSNYSPSFTIKNAKLTEAASSLASGRHYLKFTYKATDNGGNATDETEIGYALWCEESDVPHAKKPSTLIESGSTYFISPETLLPLDFFDDDSIDTVIYGIISVSDFLKISGSTNDEKIETLKDSTAAANAGLTVKTFDSNSATRDYSVSLKSGTEINSEYYIIALVKDGTANSVWNTIYVPFTIHDSHIPIIIITSPQENTIPALSTDGKTFKIEGYTLDTGSAGCTSLKAAWITNTNSNKKTATLAAIKSDSTAAGSSSIPSDGIKIWNVALGKAAETEVSGSTYYKQTFSITTDITSDFMYNSTIENAQKFIEFYAVNSIGNTESIDYVLQGDTELPTITTVNPSADLQGSLPNKAFAFEFYASKTSGLSIDQTSYSIYEGTTLIADTDSSTTTGGTLDVDSSNGHCTYTMDGTNFKNEGNRTFTFSAKDILGNKASLQKTIVVGSVASLKSITSTNSNGTYKAGDKITLKAVFDNVVVVNSANGKPQLKVSYTSDGEIKYVDYTSGSGTTTLEFTYTVPTGAASEKLYCSSIPIYLNGGVINTKTSGGASAVISELSGTNLQDNKSIALDGVSPTISSIAVSGGSGGYFKSGDIITAAVKTSESLLISGSPELSLISGSGTIACSLQSLSGSTLTFTHTVTSSDKEGQIGYNLSSCFTSINLAYITDVAGNSLTAGTNSNVNLSRYIDCTAPEVPTVTPDAGTYNVNKSLTVTGAESGGTLYYSTDGGMSWLNYSSPVTLGNGTYYITAYQKDSAGNKSTNTTTKTIVVNGAFPVLQDITCTLPDGTYAAGTVVTFKMSFSDKVIASTTSSASITLNNGNDSNTANDISIPVTVTSSAGSSALTFTYTVESGVVCSPVALSAVSISGLTDSYGNKGSTGTALTSAYASRSGLIIDAVAPTLSSVAPSGSTTTGGTTIAKSGNIVTLTFSENVSKESGSITIMPASGWYIPPVLSATDFNTVYDALNGDSTKQTYLLETDSNGTEVYDSKTGQPVGPYMKITHGLKEESSTYVPDTDTKYVLRFDIPIDGSTTDSFNIRTALEAAGYLQQTLDVTSSSVVVNDKTVTVTFPKALADGREWVVVIDKGTFSDSTGNIFEGLNTSTKTDYLFWSDKVATPVVRVDRYSHGWGAVEPSSSCVTTDTSTNLTVISDASTNSTNTGTTSTSTAPTGYVRVRIDCETPGATVKYGTTSKIATVSKSGGKESGTTTTAYHKDGYNGETLTSNNNYIGEKWELYKTSITPNGTATISAAYEPSGDSLPTSMIGTSSSVVYYTTTTTAETTYANFIIDADAGKYTWTGPINATLFTSTNGVKSIITTLSAITSATLTGLSTETDYTNNTAFVLGDGSLLTSRRDYVAASATKTNFTNSGKGYEGAFKTVYVFANNSNSYGNIRVEGSNVSSGMPTISGFPLRDADPDVRYGKFMYEPDGSGTTGYWISYEVISDISIIPVRSNWAYNYTKGSYGNISYVIDQGFN